MFSFTTIVAIVLAFAAAAAVVRLFHWMIRRFENALVIVSAENRAAVHARALQLGRALTLLAYAIAAIATVSLTLERVGISEPQWQPRQITHWLVTHGINVVIITVGAVVVIRAANLAIEHLQHKIR